jgi:hypothetical protein
MFPKDTSEYQPYLQPYLAEVRASIGIGAVYEIVKIQVILEIN